MMTHYTRRELLGTALSGMAAGVAFRDRPSLGSEPTPPMRLPRQVWIATICQAGMSAAGPQEMTEKMLSRMNEILPQQPDLICLPEMFHVANLKGPRPSLQSSSEVAIGSISKPFAEFAQRHRCHVICPISTVDQGRYYNAAVVIDRDGQYVGEYRKINPTAGELKAGFLPGPLDPPVFELDFGTIGIQTCYDINWHDNWRRLRQKGAEIVFWPSAFAGGRMLNALAWINKYFVVSSTRIHSSMVVDVLGDEIASTGRFDDWVCTPLNLDVAVVQTHQNIDRLDEVRAKYGRRVDIKVQHVEAWARIEVRTDEFSVSDLLQEFELETAEAMFARETKRQNELRPAP